MGGRMCIACRRLYERNILLRIVRIANTGKIVISNDRKIQGRSAWLCQSVSCIRKAVKEHRVDKALRLQVSDDVIAQLEYLAEQFGV